VIRFPALAGALALLCAPAHASAQTHARTTIENQAVAKIVYHRKMTWRWQDRAGHARSETAHRERRAALPALRRLAFYWEHRHYLAWKRWVESNKKVSTPPAVDSCLATIIEREGSGGDPHATNPSTGAYGIPQALPGSKMASAGADWATNPATQIRWMIGYVNGRYGGSCAALAHSYAYGWY
jgi:hypothetical protein